MGNLILTGQCQRDAASGVSSNGCVENRDFRLAPRVGFEPTTLRLTAEQLVAASHCKQGTYSRDQHIYVEIGGTLLSLRG